MLDLRKEMVLDLKKKAGIATQQAQVILALDYSGSMHSLYADGTVQKVVERIFPVALSFDADKEMEFYLFHDSFIQLPVMVKEDNHASYIKKHVLGKYQMGGTNYAPVLQNIVDNLFMIFHTEEVETKGGFLGLFKKKESVTTKVPITAKPEHPTYVIFITDGNCMDQTATVNVIREASNKGIFFQFIGIGREAFTFLDKLDNLSGRVIDNANFFKVTDINKMSDEELYSNLMNEFPSWLTQAKSHNII